jgi:alpha-tubulin suppressor-like RCC1 family protein
LHCWGANESGQLGIGNTEDRGDDPGEVATSSLVDLGGGTVASLALGAAFSCALFDDGRVKCWGANDNGQLGLGNTAPRGTTAASMGAGLPYVDVGGAAVQIVAGAAHACALLGDGRVHCWGNNEHGQLGLEDVQNRGDVPATVPSALPAVRFNSPARMLAAGADFTCALLGTGVVKCWGGNAAGQLGQGTTVGTRGGAPGEMTALPSTPLGGVATRIGANGRFACARLVGQRVKCWGDNTSGQLGYGDTVSRGSSLVQMGDNLPVVGNTTNLVMARLGGAFDCALLTNGSVHCWGANDFGQLGFGDTTPRREPGGAVDLGTPTVTAITAGGGHACALAGSQIKCWGRNDRGQLGLGDVQTRGNTPGTMGAALPFVPLP